MAFFSVFKHTKNLPLYFFFFFNLRDEQIYNFLINIFEIKTVHWDISIFRWDNVCHLCTMSKVFNSFHKNLERKRPCPQNFSAFPAQPNKTRQWAVEKKKNLQNYTFGTRCMSFKQQQNNHKKCQQYWHLEFFTIYCSTKFDDLISLVFITINVGVSKITWDSQILFSVEY